MNKPRPIDYIWKSQFDGDIHLHEMLDSHVINLVKFAARKVTKNPMKYDSIVNLTHPLTLKK